MLLVYASPVLFLCMKAPMAMPSILDLSATVSSLSCASPVLISMEAPMISSTVELSIVTLLLYAAPVLLVRKAPEASSTVELFFIDTVLSCAFPVLPSKTAPVTVPIFCCPFVTVAWSTVTSLLYAFPVLPFITAQNTYPPSTEEFFIIMLLIYASPVLLLFMKAP